MADNNRFLAALEEIHRRGPAAAALVPDLAALIDDERTAWVDDPDPRRHELDEPGEFVSRGRLAAGALASIGDVAVAYLLERYRSGENRGLYARAIAAMGPPGLAAVLSILRELASTRDPYAEAIRSGLLFSLTLNGSQRLFDARYDRLRELIRNAWRDEGAREQLVSELGRLTSQIPEAR